MIMKNETKYVHFAENKNERMNEQKEQEADLSSIRKRAKIGRKQKHGYKQYLFYANKQIIRKVVRHCRPVDMKSTRQLI